MSLAALMTDEVTLIRTTAYDQDSTGAPTNPTETNITVPCYAEPLPATGTESRPDRGTGVQDWMVVVPPGTDVDGYDEALLHGLRMMVIAPPSPFTDVLGLGNDHIQLRLQRIDA